MEEAIMKLWNEAKDLLYIALKLGIYDELQEPDIEYIERVIDTAYQEGGTRTGAAAR